MIEILTSLELWERPFFDLWSIPHFLFGFIAFYILLKKGIKRLFSFFIVIVVAIFWEIFEHYTPVEEFKTNMIADVILAGIGFIVASIIKKGQKYKDKIILKYSIAIFLIFNILGYLAAFIRNY